MRKDFSNSLLIRISLSILIVIAIFLPIYFQTDFEKVTQRGNLPELQIEEFYGRLPMRFERNDGQTDEQIDFLSRGKGHTVFLNSTGAVLSLRDSETSQSARFLQMRLVGANPQAEGYGLDELVTKSNYFIGNDPGKWRADIPNYARVKYQNVYSGVDLVYYGNQGQLEYDFVVAPGADPDDIILELEGAEDLSIDDEGNLIMPVSKGELILKTPVIYQVIDGDEQIISGRYALAYDNRVHFEIGAYETSQPLVIDPVLSYSTYLGGSNYDSGEDIAVDAEGNAYVTGSTWSNDFPIANAFQSDLRTTRDVFVLKLDSTGTSIVYSTYLGGDIQESGQGIAVDAGGNVCVMGWTTSNNFPTVNAVQGALALNNRGVGRDAFVTKLNATGSALLFSTYLGGSENELEEWMNAGGIAVDTEGNIYITGSTHSDDFPIANAFQSSFSGLSDVFVSKLSSGGGLVYSSYYGGTDFDSGNDIAVDAQGNAYVTGRFDSFFRTYVLLLKVNATSSLDRVITLGDDHSMGSGIALDSVGNIYLTGFTEDDDFPRVHPLKDKLGGYSDAFVTKLSPGFSIVYSTYLGGSDVDNYSESSRIPEGDIAVDNDGNAYVTGNTISWDFPMVDAVQNSYGGEYDYDEPMGDAFVSKLHPRGDSLIFSTFLGGSDDEIGSGIAVDPGGNIYITGLTRSTNFPTADSMQAAIKGPQDAFITKIGIGGEPGIAVSPDPIVFLSVDPGDTKTVTVEVTSAGTAPLEIQNITVEPTPPFTLESVPDLPDTLEPGTKTQFDVRYSPTTSAALKTSDSFSNSDQGTVTIVSNVKGNFTEIAVEAREVAIEATPVRDEIKLGGDLTRIKVKVLDKLTGQIESEFDGNASYRILDDKSTAGIGWRLTATSSLIVNGIAQDVFFETTKELFDENTPITAQTVLSGKAFIEVSLDNVDIPAEIIKVEVKSPLDFSIERIEIQQGIVDSEKERMLEFQDGEMKKFDPLPFIAEHSTVARIVVGYENTIGIPFSAIEAIDGISSELTIFRDDEIVGTEKSHWLSPQYRLQDLDGNGKVETTDYDLEDQRDLRDALYIVIDASMVKEPDRYKFEATLDLVSDLDETVEEKKNNNKPIEKEFVETKSFKVLAMVASPRAEANFPQVSVNVWSFLKKVYPIQESKLDFTDPNTRKWRILPLTLSDCVEPGKCSDVWSRMEQILDRYNDKNRNDQREKLVAFTASRDLIKTMCGEDAGACALGRVSITTISGSETLAHELGHTLGLRDTYKTDKYETRDGPPNPRRDNAKDKGNYVEHGTIYLNLFSKAINTDNPNTGEPFNPYFDFMGSAHGSRWSDRVTWDHLYQTKFRLGAAPSFKLASADSFIAISGGIDLNDTVTLNPFLALSIVPAVSAPEAGDYSIEFLDGGGMVLSTHNFDVEFHIPEVGDVSEVTFSFNLPLPENTSKVAMRKKGVEIASRTFSENPPAIELTSPSAGESIADITTIEWTASDPDGDELTYDILYSPDGQEQIVVDVNIKDTSFEWDSSLFPNSSSASVTVIANDGINEARATSDNLVVSVVDEVENTVVPTDFALHQNYPNPFNPETTIRYDVPQQLNVRVEIFDILGRKVRTLINQRQPAGSYSITWDGRNNTGQIVTSGIYIYRIQAGNFTQSRKVIFLR